MHQVERLSWTGICHYEFAWHPGQNIWSFEWDRNIPSAWRHNLIWPQDVNFPSKSSIGNWSQKDSASGALWSAGCGGEDSPQGGRMSASLTSKQQGNFSCAAVAGNDGLGCVVSSPEWWSPLSPAFSPRAPTSCWMNLHTGLFQTMLLVFWYLCPSCSLVCKLSPSSILFFWPPGHVARLNSNIFCSTQPSLTHPVPGQVGGTLFLFSWPLIAALKKLPVIIIGLNVRHLCWLTSDKKKPSPLHYYISNYLSAFAYLCIHCVNNME